MLRIHYCNRAPSSGNAKRIFNEPKAKTWGKTTPNFCAFSNPSGNDHDTKDSNREEQDKDK